MWISAIGLGNHWIDRVAQPAMAGICLLKIYVKVALELPVSYQCKISLSIEMHFVINTWKLNISNWNWSVVNSFETAALSQLTLASTKMQVLTEEQGRKTRYDLRSWKSSYSQAAASEEACTCFVFVFLRKMKKKKSGKVHHFLRQTHAPRE